MISYSDKDRFALGAMRYLTCTIISSYLNKIFYYLTNMTMETPEKKELIKHFIRHGISLAEKDQLSLAGEEGRPIKPSLEKQKELLDFTSETSEYIYLLLKDIKDK